MHLYSINAQIAAQRLITIIALEINEQNTEIIARVDLKTTGRVAEFKWLYTSQPRKGIGSMLLRACEAQARKEQCESISCMIDADNLGVIPFYKRFGFIVCVEYEDGSVGMVKAL